MMDVSLTDYEDAIVTRTLEDLPEAIEAGKRRGLGKRAPIHFVFSNTGPERESWVSVFVGDENVWESDPDAEPFMIAPLVNPDMPRSNFAAGAYAIKTVAELRAAMVDLPDDAPVAINAPGALHVELMVDVGVEDRHGIYLDVPTYTF